MLAPRRRCLDYPKVDCDITKRWSLAWNQNKPGDQTDEAENPNLVNKIGLANW